MPNRHILFLHRFRADDTENVVCDHREFQNQSVCFKFTAWQSFNSHIGFYFAVKLLTNRMVMVKFDNPDIINPSITRTREEPEESCVPAADMIDGMDFEQLKEERACYAQIVRDNTDYDILVEQFPEQADEINELISIMVDVICSQKKTIRANGEEKPHDVVKSRLLKLNSSHIEYVLAALKKNTSDVRNIRSYLITALYNAPVTMSSFYRAEVNHDMFGKR